MDPLTVVLFIILFFLSAFFSGTEIALMSLPLHKIDSLLKNDKWGAKTLKYIKQHNDRLLIAILIGNNLVNVYTAALATQISIGIAKASGVEEALAVGVATGIITFLLLMFGEIIPKSYATKNAENIALFVAPIYKVLMVILSPLIILIEFFIKIFTGKAKNQTITGEELEIFIDMGKDAGTLDREEHERIKNILEFGEISVEDIMTPRVDIMGVSEDISVEKALEYYMQHTKSRLPVYKGTPDKIHSILTIRDLLTAKKEGNEKKLLKELSLSSALKVPLNQPIEKLFEVFQRSHRHIAIVIDEYGGVAGLITLEDIIEEVFGEIRDETDKELDEIQKVGEDLYIVDSTAMIDDVLEVFNLELEHIGVDDHLSTETLSYILTHKIERFPNSGETITFDVFGGNEEEKKGGSLLFKILDIADGKIGKVEMIYKKEN